jgi:hypothetical protein
MSAPHGPRFGTPRKWRFAGEIDYTGGGRAFGCADGLEWPSLQTREVLPQRGLAAASRRGLEGVHVVTDRKREVEDFFSSRDKYCHDGGMALAH